MVLTWPYLKRLLLLMFLGMLYVLHFVNVCLEMTINALDAVQYFVENVQSFVEKCRI